MIITGGEKQAKFYISVWATVQRTITPLAPLACMGIPIAPARVADNIFLDERYRIELSFTQNFWINITFTVVLVALFSRWVMYLYVGTTVI